MTRQKRLLRNFIVLMSILVVLLFIGIGYILLNPDALQANRPPTPTIFVLNPSATLDPRGTLPPTWTPTRTASPAPTLTPRGTNTPTQTSTSLPTLPPTVTFTQPAPIPPGWSEFVSRDGRFAMQFNSTWLPLTVLTHDAEVIIEDIAERSPAQAESIRHTMGLSGFADLVAIGYDSATADETYVVNMIVAFPDDEQGETVDEIFAYRLDKYESDLGIDIISMDATTVDFQHTQRIRYSRTFTTASGETLLTYHVEVITQGAGRRDPMLIFTMSASEGRRNVYEGIFDKITASIRFLR